jgi:hypothetical protein
MYLRINKTVTRPAARLITDLRVYALAGRDSHPLDEYSKFQNATDHVLPFGPAFPGRFRYSFSWFSPLVVFLHIANQLFARSVVEPIS